MWQRQTATARTIYCDVCSAKTAAPATSCSACGTPLDDTFLRDPSIAQP